MPTQLRDARCRQNDDGTDKPEKLYQCSIAALNWYNSLRTYLPMTFDFTFDAATGHITITEGSTEVPDSIFQSKSEIKSVSIPDTITSIGDSAFRSTSLTEVIIPDSVTSIGRYAFSGNELTEVVIPDSVTSIGRYAFSGNELTEVFYQTR